MMCNIYPSRREIILGIGFLPCVGGLSVAIAAHLAIDGMESFASGDLWGGFIATGAIIIPVIVAIGTVFGVIGYISDAIGQYRYKVENDPD